MWFNYQTRTSLRSSGRSGMVLLLQKVTFEKYLKKFESKCWNRKFNWNKLKKTKLKIELKMSGLKISSRSKYEQCFLSYRIRSILFVSLTGCQTVLLNYVGRLLEIIWILTRATFVRLCNTICGFFNWRELNLRQMVQLKVSSLKQLFRCKSHF